MSKYPVQIQASNDDANDAFCVTMCHVFDHDGQVTIMNALCKAYLHVIAWDKDGNQVAEYDNR